MRSVDPSFRLLIAALIAVGPVPAFGSTFSIELGHWLASELAHTADPALSGVNRDVLTLAYQRGEEKLVRELTYAYEEVSLHAGAPATNGHLHRIGVRSGVDIKRLALEVEAGLHGSSNRFKHREFDREAVVLQFAMHYRSTSAIGIGVYGDYRFGGFHVYPGLLATFAFEGSGEVELDLPRSARWYSRERRWTVGIERYGQKWSALDRAQETASKYYLDEWRLSAGFNGKYQPISWGASIGVSFDTDIQYFDLIEGSDVVALESGVFVELYVSL